MSSGLQIWDASGNLVLDASHRCARVFDLRLLANGQNGSVTDAGLTQGAFVSFQPDSYIGWLSGGPDSSAVFIRPVYRDYLLDLRGQE